MAKTRWKVRELSEDDNKSISNLQKELKVDRVVVTLLCQRGIKTFDEAKSFFRPQLADLHDPFLMKDMDKAVDRLERAIKNKEKVLIFGDYDVDGTTATALMIRFLHTQNANVNYYIPDRMLEGYGLSQKGIDEAINLKIDLLISVDCGIKGNKYIKQATDAGIDVIVCDHHEEGEELPEAYAILDPKRTDCKYPFKELSGCGVAFKLLQGYAQKHNIDISEITQYLDLVAVSIGSDIVPIIGENRILAHHGLIRLYDKPCVGLESLKELTGLTGKEVKINDIVFKIGPRINAAGRVNTANQSVELLITEDSDKAMKICQTIDAFNLYRKELDSKITEQAILQIKENEKLLNAYSTIVYNESWNKGIVGIVASRLIEYFYRPTIVFTKVESASKELIAGSARSVEGFDLYKAITSCSDLLENFGGHTFAAGLTLKKDNLPAFRERFEEYVKNNITEEQRNPIINVDMKIQIKDITPSLYRIINEMAPFGPGNMTPIFVSHKIFDNGMGKKIGKNEEHLKLRLVEKPGDNNCIDAVGFGFGDGYDLISEFKPFDICYHITENNFMNKTSIQLQVLDMKPSFNIRFAVETESATILYFIKKLAEYEKLLPEVEATEATIYQSIFVRHEAEVIFAEESGNIVGFALFFHNFSTFVGRKGLYLEDLFVLPEKRGLGYGKALLKFLAEIAIARNCGRMEWVCLDWNKPSIDFYKSIGAEPLSDWTIYRLNEDKLKEFAK